MQCEFLKQKNCLANQKQPPRMSRQQQKKSSETSTKMNCFLNCYRKWEHILMLERFQLDRLKCQLSLTLSLFLLLWKVNSKSISLHPKQCCIQCNHIKHESDGELDWNVNFYTWNYGDLFLGFLSLDAVLFRFCYSIWKRWTKSIPENLNFFASKSEMQFLSDENCNRTRFFSLCLSVSRSISRQQFRIRWKQTNRCPLQQF